MAPRRIKAYGHLNARLILLGEAGGKDENKAGLPFVGLSGDLLFGPGKWLYKVGLKREDFWIDNVYPFQPPGNKLFLVNKDELAKWTENLHERLAKLEDPWLIVPTGETALKALTGKTGIGKHRGSIYEYIDRRDRHIKVIPTYHPAFTFRDPLAVKTCLADWKRINEDRHFRELRLPEREHFINPTFNDLQWYSTVVAAESRKSKNKCLYEGLHDDPHFSMAIDLEWTTDKILMTGFSCDPAFSFTVPTTEEFWKGKKKLAEVMKWIKMMCQCDVPKIFQHGHSDTYILKYWHSIDVKNWHWDTLAEHHCLDPNRPHTLQYMASIDTRQPYWKDEAKNPEEIAKYANNFTALSTYNGIDCCVERELHGLYIQKITERGLLDFYRQHYAATFEPLLRLMLHGVRVDAELSRRRKAFLIADCIDLQDRLTAVVGEKVHGKKSLSGKKLMKFFYEDEKCAQILRTRHKKGGDKVRTLSVDEVAVRRLMLKYADKKPRVVEVGELVLKHRRKYILSGFYG